MSNRKSVDLGETGREDTEFIAAYQGKSVASYIKKCVEAENQRRFKSIKQKIDEEIHVSDLLNLPHRLGNESELEKVIGLIVKKCLEREMSEIEKKLRRKSA